MSANIEAVLSVAIWISAGGTLSLVKSTMKAGSFRLPPGAVMPEASNNAKVQTALMRVTPLAIQIER